MFKDIIKKLSSINNQVANMHKYKINNKNSIITYFKRSKFIQILKINCERRVSFSIPALFTS